VDKGYRGHDYIGDAKVHLAGSGGKKLTRTERRRRKRRSAVEPKIGHAKSDHRMGRCFLKGLPGDAINATLAAAGANLRKLLNLLSFALIQWLGRLMIADNRLCIAPVRRLRFIASPSGMALAVPFVSDACTISIAAVA